MWFYFIARESEAKRWQHDLEVHIAGQKQNKIICICHDSFLLSMTQKSSLLHLLAQWLLPKHGRT